MLVARLIKQNTILYRKIGERMQLFDTLFLMRPPLFFLVWTTVLAGVSAASAAIEPELYWVRDFSWWAVILFTGASLLVGAAIIRYQVQNQMADEENGKIPFFKAVGITSEKSDILIRICSGAGLILILLSSIFGRLEGSGWAGKLGVFWGLLVFFFWGILYSDPKFHWWAKPVLGLATHFLAGFFLFMLGWSHASGDLGLGAARSLPYALLILAVAMLTTITDLPGDRKMGKTTFAVRFGVRATAGWSTLFVAVSVTMGYLLGDSIISTASIVSLPFFLAALVFTRMDYVQRAVKYPIFILAMFICVRYPWFFVALFITFYFSKYYYYFRFNVDYPTFHVSSE